MRTLCLRNVRARKLFLILTDQFNYIPLIQHKYRHICITIPFCGVKWYMSHSSQTEHGFRQNSETFLVSSESRIKTHETIVSIGKEIENPLAGSPICDQIGTSFTRMRGTWNPPRDQNGKLWLVELIRGLHGVLHRSYPSSVDKFSCISMILTMKPSFLLCRNLRI